MAQCGARVPESKVWCVTHTHTHIQAHMRTHAYTLTHLPLSLPLKREKREKKGEKSILETNVLAMLGPHLQTGHDANDEQQQKQECTGSAYAANH